MSSRNKMAKNLQCLSVSTLKIHHQSQDLKVLQFWGGGGGGARPFFSVIIIPALAPKITSLSSLSPSPRPDPRPQTQTLGERSVRPGPTSSTTTLHRERVSSNPNSQLLLTAFHWDSGGWWKQSRQGEVFKVWLGDQSPGKRSMGGQISSSSPPPPTAALLPALMQES